MRQSFCRCCCVVAALLVARAARADAGATADPRAWALSVGGQVRVRGDFTRNQSLTDLGFAPARDEAQVLERTRVHVTATSPGAGVTLFAQGQWYGRWGGAERRSEADLYQAFVEWRAPDAPLAVTVGRQELVYGSGFALAANDFYNGLTWDAVELTLRPRTALAVDVFGGAMAKLNPGDPDIYLAGVYAAYRGLAAAAIDAYVLHTRGGFPFFHREVELRDSGQRWYTAGLRATGALGRLSYEIEPQVQWGRVKAAMGSGTDDVRAYGGHVDAGYTFAAPWQPRVFAAYGFGSGHTDVDCGTYGEFHGDLFHDDALVGDMGVVPDLSGLTVNGVHASGMHAASAGISLAPLATLGVTFDVHRFVAADAPGELSRDLGLELDLAAAYQPAPWLAIAVGVSRFIPGAFVRRAAASTAASDYAYVQTQVDF